MDSNIWGNLEWTSVVNASARHRVYKNIVFCPLFILAWTCKFLTITSSHLKIWNRVWRPDFQDIHYSFTCPVEVFRFNPALQKIIRSLKPINYFCQQQRKQMEFPVLWWRWWMATLSFCYKKLVWTQELVYWLLTKRPLIQTILDCGGQALSIMGLRGPTGLESSIWLTSLQWQEKMLSGLQFRVEYVAKGYRLDSSLTKIYMLLVSVQDIDSWLTLMM